jgi:hypothetical protein
MTAPNSAASKPNEMEKREGAGTGVRREAVPFKPRRGLFVVLGIILVLWLGAVGMMRWKTVKRPAATGAGTQPAVLIVQ